MRRRSAPRRSVGARENASIAAMVAAILQRSFHCARAHGSSRSRGGARGRCRSRGFSALRNESGRRIATNAGSIPPRHLVERVHQSSRLCLLLELFGVLGIWEAPSMHCLHRLVGALVNSAWLAFSSFSGISLGRRGPSPPALPDRGRLSRTPRDDGQPRHHRARLVWVHAGKIAGCGRDSEGAGRPTVVDATGKWLTPGIIDPHSHSALDSDVNEATSPVTP